MIGTPKPEGDVVDVDPALFCQERLLAEDPEVTAPTGHFQRCGDAIQFQFTLQLAEIEERIVVVGVDGDPLTALRLRVDGVQADGEPAGQVFADGRRVELQRLAAILILRLIVVMPPRFRVRVGRLSGVGLAVNEQGPPVANVLLL